MAFETKEVSGMFLPNEKKMLTRQAARMCEETLAMDPTQAHRLLCPKCLLPGERRETEPDRQSNKEMIYESMTIYVVRVSSNARSINCSHDAFQVIRLEPQSGQQAKETKQPSIRRKWGSCFYICTFNGICSLAFFFVRIGLRNQLDIIIHAT